MKKKIVTLSLALFLVGGAVMANSLKLNLNGFHFVAPAVNGKANVYQPQAGEIVYDSSDAGFWGYDQAGSWVSLGSAGSSTPVGSLLPFAGASAPAGYKLANGESLIRNDYLALYNVIGTTYGAADDDHFTLPNTQNIFLRGANTSSRAIVIGAKTVTYPPVALGALAFDMFQGHHHSLENGTNNPYYSGGLPFTTAGSGTFGTRVGDPTDDGSHGDVRFGSETAPVNLGVNYIIKY